MLDLRLVLQCLKGETIQPNENEDPRPETKDDLTGDALKQYEGDIEVMDLIIISIPNDIYNSVDACQTTQEMWLRVERLMQGTALTVVERETRFNNEFDQFTAELEDSLVSVYNHFTQLMNDLKRNKIDLPTVTINTKFLNCLQPEWLKYVTSVRLTRDLTNAPYDDLFDYLQQYEKIVIASREKKLEKTHDTLALVAHTSSSRFSPAYYVTHPPSVIDYDNEYQGETFQNDLEDSHFCNDATCLCNHSANVKNDGRIARHSYNVQEETAEGSNIQKEAENDSKYFMEQMLLAKKDKARVILSNEQNDFLLTDVVQINIIFDDPNVEVNNGNSDHDNHVHDSYELEQLARNASKEVKKQQMLANKTKFIEADLKTKQLQNAQNVLKREMNADEDKYLDDILNLEAKVKTNENVVIKMSQSVQALFMLGPKPLSFYDLKLKHGLGYENPYTLKKAIAYNPKLYYASCLNSSKVHVNVCDTEEILKDATNSQIKMENILKDLIAIEKKQNFHPID
ncbi:hypothetical protein Tco_1247078 [Tanacetum coccineum]